MSLFKQGSARGCALALLSGLIGAHASAAVTASTSVTNVSWTTSKIDTSIAGASGASLVSASNNGGFQGLAWLSSSAQLPVALPGTTQHISQTYNNAQFTGSSTFDNGANGWNLSTTSSAATGVYSPLSQLDRGGASGTIVYSENNTNSGPFQGGLLLAANTRITFTGALSGAINIDVSDATGPDFFAGADIYNSFSAYLNPVGADYYVATDTGSSQLNNRLSLGSRDLAANPGLSPQISADYGVRPFNFSLSNTSNQAVWVAVRSGASLTIYQEFTAPPTNYPPYQPSIPEPQTWLMMGIGLAGIGVAARRRRG